MFEWIKNYFSEKKLNKLLNNFIDELEFYWYSFKEFKDSDSILEMINPIGKIEIFTFEDIQSKDYLEKFVENLDNQLESILQSKWFALIEYSILNFKNSVSGVVYFKVLNGSLEEIYLTTAQILGMKEFNK